jgi:peroxiredoxin
MTVRQQWLIVGIVVAVLGGGLFAGVRLFADELFPVGVGSAAPSFTAKDVHSGATRTLANYRGEVVLLNIWATWCEPCKVEMPSMEELYRAYGPRGVHIVAVSIDDAVGEDSIRAYAKQLRLTFEILHDPTGGIERAYQATGYPESFVIDRGGVIRRKWISATDWNAPASRALFDELLGAPAPPRPVAVTER